MKLIEVYCSGTKTFMNPDHIVRIIAPGLTEDQGVCYIELVDRDSAIKVQMNCEVLVQMIRLS
jgi:hypothetical protein